MSETTSRYGLPLMAADQAQKHVTHNEALVLLDLLSGICQVLDRDLTEPPEDAHDGDLYILGGAGESGWVGYDAGDLAASIDGGWRRIAPSIGMIAAIRDEAGLLLYWTGSTWSTDMFGFVRREVLTSGRTYYVRTDGSDGNTGLANSSAGAFKTIGKALAVAGGLDCSIYNVTIQVADGTYAEAVSLPQMLGSGTFTLRGNSANPGNCVLSPSSGRPLAAISCGAWTVRGFTFTPATGVADCVYATDATKLTLANPVFSPVNGYQLRAERGAVAIFSGTVTIDGGANYHVACNNATVQAVSVNYVIEGTPRFNTAFFSASNAGMVQCNGMTYTGSATGRRYFVITNGVVNSYGGGEDFLPGDAAGTTQTGGVYG